MPEFPIPLRHADAGTADDETLARDARAHLARSPHLQVMAEIVAKLRSSSFPWWSVSFTRSQWRALPRMQWLAQRPDLRQKITSALTGLPRKAARSKTPEFQASLVDAVLEHGDVGGAEFEEAFAPEDLVTYGPAAQMWTQFRQRMPWGDDGDAHRKLVGWVLRVLLSERSTLDPDMLRRPILTAWDVRNAIDPHVFQEHVPLDVRAQIDEARLKREKARPREPYSARHELQIATPELLAQHIPLTDLVAVFEVAEQAMLGAPEQSIPAESGAFPSSAIPRISVASGLPNPPTRTSSVSSLAALSAPRPLAVAR
jgi:hypothetical protein